MLRLLFCLALIACLPACAPQDAGFHATDITGSAFGRHLALRDHDGRPRSLEQFRGKAVVVFFGYTACPDVCPTTLARYARVMQILGKQAGQVQVLFVTLDPERDTPARLKQFVPWFHPGFIGLYGSRAEIDAAAKEFKVFSARREGGGLGYTLDHTAASYVFDPAGRLRLYVADGMSAEDIAADLGRLLAGR